MWLSRKFIRNLYFLNIFKYFFYILWESSVLEFYFYYYLADESNVLLMKSRIITVEIKIFFLENGYFLSSQVWHVFVLPFFSCKNPGFLIRRVKMYLTFFIRRLIFDEKLFVDIFGLSVHFKIDIYVAVICAPDVSGRKKRFCHKLALHLRFSPKSPEMYIKLLSAKNKNWNLQGEEDFF